MKEEVIQLDKFKPREYQIPLINALEKDGYRRIIAVMPRRCLSGATHITMHDGSFKLLKDIEVGDKILSFNGAGFVEDTVKHKWSTGIKKTVLVNTRGNLPLVSSLDHVFATINEHNSPIAWQPLKDIGSNDYLICYLGNKDHYSLTTFTYSDQGEEELFDIETETHHNFIANGLVVHNSGKDITAFNIAIRQCLKKVGTVFYVFPTFSQGRRVIWDAIQNDGMRILDYIPKELVESRNEQQMRIRFVNGSVLQIIGSDNYDNTLVGTNPMGVIFSEFALSDPRAYQFVRPILTANGGWCFIQSTPRGRNAFHDLWKIAQDNPQSWFSYRKSVDDTKHVNIEDIRKEIDEGELSEELALQEYWCSWDLGVEGSYYSKYMDKMNLEGRIGNIPWDPSNLVHTAWDLGHDDENAIIFFQSVNNAIYIIDYYEKNKESMEHYIEFIKKKPYMYGVHIVPHDIKVHEYSDGLTRKEKASRLGVDFSVAPKIRIEDGIESVRTVLPRVYIDKNNAARLIRCLENYRQEFDPIKNVHAGKPRHDQFSHGADAMRHLATGLKMITKGMTEEDVRRMYREAHYGSQSNIPDFFRTNHSLL